MAARRSYGQAPDFLTLRITSEVHCPAPTQLEGDLAPLARCAAERTWPTASRISSVNEGLALGSADGFLRHSFEALIMASESEVIATWREDGETSSVCGRSEEKEGSIMPRGSG
jgi:hypothetical protein